MRTLSLLFLLAACAGADGATGPQGPIGPQGPQGDPGPTDIATREYVVFGGGRLLSAEFPDVGTNAIPAVVCMLSYDAIAGDTRNATWAIVGQGGPATCTVRQINGVWRGSIANPEADLGNIQRLWTAAWVVTYRR